jgi:pilus assembly protein CpaB
MLGMALVFAFTAVFLARGWLAQQVRPVVVQEEKLPTQTVVVARSQLRFGNRIGPEHVREIPWPADSLPVGAFQKVQDMFAEEDRRVVLKLIEINEPVLATKLSGGDGRATLSATITEDMRALTIRVNDVLGVAGFILPGDRVDVLLTREVRKNTPITDLLLQNVKVLGIDQEASEDKEKPKVARAVTLEVTPRQAQKLTLATEVGTLSLALRNRQNAQAYPARTMTVEDLKASEVNDPEKPVAKAVKPAKTKVKARVARVRKSKGDDLTSVKVVRALKPSDYKVVQEKTDPRPVLPPSSLVAPLSGGSWSAEEANPAGPADAIPPRPVNNSGFETRNGVETVPLAPGSTPISLLPESFDKNRE